MSSFTVTLTGNTSELSASFFPEIVLDDRYDYSCGLLDFTTYQSIPNITESNNKLYFEHNKSIAHVYIPVGCYEIHELLKYIKQEFDGMNISFNFEVNKNTLKATLKCSVVLLFDYPDSVHEVLGFTCKKIEPNRLREAEQVIRISKLNVIRVECNIVSGAYINGRLCHSIYEFAGNKVDVGYKITEQPSHVIYLPVIPRRIDHIQISVVDQNGEPVDFRGEDITCRIHIKRNER